MNKINKFLSRANVAADVQSKTCGIIFMSLCAQVMWRCMDRPIARLNRNHRLSLKGGVHGTFLLISESF